MTDKQDDEYRHVFMEEHLLKIVRKERPEALLIAGDLTEEKDRHRSRLVNRIARQIDNLAAECPVLVLMGNHDYANEGFPYFDFIHRFRDVDFVGRQTVASSLLKPFREPFRDCLFLPHTRDYERDWHGLEFKKYRAVFCHNTFEQAQSEHGSRLKGIPLDVMDGARVFCGDVHTPQATGPVTYIGAPYTIDYGDDYQARMLRLKGDKPSWIMLDKLPQKRLVHIEEGKDLEDYAKHFREGDLVKVRVDVDDIKGFREFSDIVKAQGHKLGGTVTQVQPVVYNRTKRKNIKLDGKSQTDAELVRSFADRHKLTNATLDMGLDLLEG